MASNFTLPQNLQSTNDLLLPTILYTLPAVYLCYVSSRKVCLMRNGWLRDRCVAVLCYLVKVNFSSLEKRLSNDFSVDVTLFGEFRQFVCHLDNFRNVTEQSVLTSERNLPNSYHKLSNRSTNFPFPSFRVPLHSRIRSQYHNL